MLTDNNPEWNAITHLIEIRNLSLKTVSTKQQIFYLKFSQSTATISAVSPLSMFLMSGAAPAQKGKLLKALFLTLDKKHYLGLTCFQQKFYDILMTLLGCAM